MAASWLVSGVEPSAGSDVGRGPSLLPRPGATGRARPGAGRGGCRGFSAVSLRAGRDGRPLGGAPRRREASISVEATAEAGRPLVPALWDGGRGFLSSWLMFTPNFRMTSKVHLDTPAQEKKVPWQTLAHTIYLLGREKGSGRAWERRQRGPGHPCPSPHRSLAPWGGRCARLGHPIPAPCCPEVSGALSQEVVFAGRV